MSPDPFAALHGAVAAPPWRGPSRVHVLAGEPVGRPRARPRKWRPWTLLTSDVVAGRWDFSDMWPFPDRAP